MRNRGSRTTQQWRRAAGRWRAVAVVAVALAAVAASNTGSAATAASAGYVPTAACNAAIPLPYPPQQGNGYQVVLGVVAVPAFVAQRAYPSGLTGPWRFFDKQGLFVQAGSPAVVVSVPNAWRKRVAIGWANASSPVSVQRVASCSQPPGAWNGWPGGYYLRTSTPLCAPLVVRVGRQTATVRVGIGRSCG